MGYHGSEQYIYFKYGGQQGNGHWATVPSYSEWEQCGIVQLPLGVPWDSHVRGI